MRADGGAAAGFGREKGRPSAARSHSTFEIRPADRFGSFLARHGTDRQSAPSSFYTSPITKRPPFPLTFSSFEFCTTMMINLAFADRPWEVAREYLH